MEEKRYIYEKLKKVIGVLKSKPQDNTINLSNKYLMNSIDNPKYLFHGSPKNLNVIEPKSAADSKHIAENEDNAVFMTPSFILASAYAFKDSIKKMSGNLDWNFEIGAIPYTNEIYVIMDNVIVDDELEGYIYVFDWNDKYEQRKGMIQYKAHKEMPPIDTIKIKFKDFKKFYTINEANENIRKL